MIARFDARPDERRLRQFGVAWTFFFGMVWTPLALLRDRPQVALALWIVAVAGGLLAMARPGWLRGPWVALSLVTLPIGWIVSTAAMVLLWLLVVTPTGLALRLAGRDPMRRRRDPDAATYWLPRRRPDDASYLRRF